jgi:uncharacterized protein with HEPN domain
VSNIEKRYPDFAQDHADVPCAVAYEMRNVLAHGYFTIDLNVVWRTINNDLPDLERKVSELQQDVR